MRCLLPTREDLHRSQISPGRPEQSQLLVREAARAGEVVVVTIPEAKIRDLPRDLFAGVPDDVVVIDTGNYYPRERDGRIGEIEAGIPESRWVANQLGRPVVKVFNNIYAQHLLERGRPAETKDGSPCPWPAMTNTQRRP